MNISSSDKQDILHNVLHVFRRVRARARLLLKKNTLFLIGLGAVALLALAGGIWSVSVDRQMRRLCADFEQMDTPQRVHALARIFSQKPLVSARSYASEAQALFFDLSSEAQLALFESELDVEDDDIVAVIAGLYTALADVDGTGATTPLLEKMQKLLRERVSHPAHALRVELHAWLIARKLFTSGQAELALEGYTIATNLNCKNPALWYEKARVQLALGRTAEGLTDLEQVLALQCPPPPTPTSSPQTSTPISQPVSTAMLGPAGVPVQFHSEEQIRQAIKPLLSQYPAAVLAFTAGREAYPYLNQADLALTLTPTPKATLSLTNTPTPTSALTSGPTVTPIPISTIEFTGTSDMAEFYLVWPTQYMTITQRFGENPELYEKFGLPGHEGVDFVAPTGSGIYAAADGVVNDIRLDGDSDPTRTPYGNQIRIQHEGGYESIYAHLSEVTVTQGQFVKAGQLIGLSGNTGNSFGPHLTFVLRLAGATANGATNYPYDIIDPMPYFLLSLGVSEGGHIFGLHEVTIADYAYTTGQFLMEEKDKFGWVLFTELVGRNADYIVEAPQITEALREIAGKGFSIIVRLNHGYEPSGTLPESQYYDDFAAAVGKWVELHGEHVHVWVIGNEPNNPREYPGGSEHPVEHITPQLYAECYAKVWQQIHSLPGHEDDQVVVAPLAPFNDLPWAANQSVRPLDYFAELLDELLKSDVVPVDALALHAYTHTSDPELIFSERMFGDGTGPLYDHHYEFRIYRDFMNTIPEDLRHVPVYITEASPIYQDEEETTLGWPDANLGWIQNAYWEIYNWNAISGNQQIRALLLYRWMGDAWTIEGKYGLYADFQAAMDHEYIWFETQE
jgi:murein DD-endopeptidase MepM/ murein hydrolase activator NlpD